MAAQLLEPTSSDAYTPYLPPELWSQVLGFVDTTTLWISCRTVSQLFRSEAERGMRRHRLNALHIAWSIPYAEAVNGCACPSMQLGDISHFSAADERVHFKTNFGYQEFSRYLYGRQLEDLPWDREHLMKAFRKGVRPCNARKSKRATEQEWIRSEMSKCKVEMAFEEIEGDGHIPGLKLSRDFGEISFLWRDVVDDFFEGI